MLINNWLTRLFCRWQHVLPMWLYRPVGRFVYSLRTTRVLVRLSVVGAVLQYARELSWTPPSRRMRTVRTRYRWALMRVRQVGAYGCRYLDRANLLA